MLRRSLVVSALVAEALLVLSLLLIGRQDPQSVVLRGYQFSVLSIMGVLGWTLTAIRRDAIDARVMAAISALLAGAALAAVASPYPTTAWSSVWHAVSVAGTGLLFVHQASDATGRRNLVALLTILFGVIVLAYLAVVGSLWREWLDLGLSAGRLPLRPANIGGILPIPTWFGDAVVVTGPIALAAMWTGGRRGRVAAAAMFALAGAAIFITATRSIWLLIPVGAIIPLLGSGARYAIRASAVAVGAVVVGAIGVSITGAGGQILRDIDAGRSSAFASAVQLFLERPFVGGGPGTYGIWRLDDEIAVLSHRAFPNAHNLALNTLAETGIIGIALWAVAVGLLGWVCADAWRRRTSDRPLIVAAIAGLAMILGHAMVDVVIEQRGLLLLALMVAAIALAPEAGGRPVAAWRPRGWILAGLMLAVAVPAVPALRAEIAAISLDRADGQADATARLEGARDATSLAQDIVPAQLLLAAAADAVDDNAAAAAGVAAAFGIEGTAQHLITQAWLAVARDDLGMANQLAIEALRLDRQDPFVMLNGLALLEGGARQDLQLQALTDLLVIEPAIAIESMPSSVRALRPQASAAASERLVAEGRELGALVIALRAGNRSQADAALAAFDSTARPAYEAIVEAWFGDASRRAALYARAADDPTPDLIWSAWFVAANACDEAEARRWRRAHVMVGGQPPMVPGAPGPARAPSLWPTGYPEQVWRLALPTAPYVEGTWTYARVSPDCTSPDG